MAAACDGGDGSIPLKGEMGVPSNWSRLPSDLVNAIARKITAVDDYVRFRCVCPSWRSAAPARPRHLPIQLPWLMLPYRVDGAGEMVFYSPARWEFFRQRGAGRVRFCGSSHGWLLAVEENGPGAFLLNPITGATVPLPPMSTLPATVGCERSRAGEHVRRNIYERCVRKIVLSSDAAMEGDLVAMALYGRFWNLAFCRVGDDSWRWVDASTTGLLSPDTIQDVAYHRGRFYLIFGSGWLAGCDLSGPAASFQLLRVIAARCARSSRDDFFNQQDRLVESADGDLLLISHYKSKRVRFDQNPSTLSFTTRFVVFKLELEGQPRASKLSSIGDNVLFLGPSCAAAISAAGFSGFQANRIYAADSNCAPSDDGEEDADGSDGGLLDPEGFRRHDIFVFNLGDGRRKLLRSYSCGSSPGWQLPLWFTPSLRQ